MVDAYPGPTSIQVAPGSGGYWYAQSIRCIIFFSALRKKESPVSLISRGKRIIFIGGSPGSGTTLLQAMMDSHPLILGGPEFDRMHDIIVMRNMLHESLAKGRITFYCDYTDIDDAVAEMTEKLLLPVANANYREYLSETTPSNVLAFADLLTVFPSARMIHVVRDPRAVCNSLLTVGARGLAKGTAMPDYTTDLDKALLWIRLCVDRGLKAAQIAPDRVMTLLYEPLVLEPEKTTRKICAFLHIPWHADMMYPKEKKPAGVHSAEDIGYSLEMHAGNPDVNGLDSWKSQLSLSQQGTINDFFRNMPEYQPLGYRFDRTE